MKTLPKGMTSHQQTPEFNQESIPKGLLKNHSTAKDVWGLIRIIEGSLLYRIIEPSVEEVILTVDNHGVVEPEMLHQVEIIGPVRFRVEFYRD
jgi:tellurite resistance-related uncharacterized protein